MSLLAIDDEVINEKMGCIYLKKAVIISCFNWYFARIEPIREELLVKGYDVTVLISDFDHINKCRYASTISECEYIHVIGYKKNLSLQRIFSHLEFGRKVNSRINAIKPALIYVLLPPNNIARYCTKYKKKYFGTKLFVDVIDMWPESMPIGLLGRTAVASLWKKWRTNCIDIADHIFTECDMYRTKLSLDTDRCSTLYLFKNQCLEEQEQVRKAISERTVRNPRINVVKFAYVGSMNNIIDIPTISHIIMSFISLGKKVELHAIGDGENKVAFMEAMKNIGCDAHFYGPVFNEIEKIHILAPCDFAINIMRENVSVGLTIKSIDYFSYGLPIINNIKGDTWNIVETNKFGYNVGFDINSVDYEINHEFIWGYFQDKFNRNSFVSRIKQFI